ncbi:aldehyde dehydrogenase [Algihabitans albus]|uniref:aldehyde dehydrogenase n=1 Tax=Algihabitans albus TaxID=2164067 RepID=UPI000E5CA24B|nr:aldehyde dehydrogenase [Algihabitans albus]
MAAALSFDDLKSRAAGLQFRSQAFIGGRYVDAVSGETFDCISPVDGRVLTQVAACGAEDVDRAVKAARAAFETGVWRDMAPARRKAKLLKFAELIKAHHDELALLETLDMGKPIGDSHAVDVPATVNCIRWYAEAADKIYDEVAPTDPKVLAMIRREPVGVVAAIVPWNFPMIMAAWKIGPALASGNSLILKPAEQSSLSAIRIAELAAEAGIPEGVFQVVPGLGEQAGKALGLHEDIDAIAFTGSGEVGKLLLQYSGQSNMKRVALECGGKTPHIVLADTSDLDQAAEAAAWGIFFNQGEVCNAGSRLLVQESIKEALMEKLLKISRSIKVGNPLDPQTKMGAIVDRDQMDKVLRYIGIGQQEGAQLVLGGQQVQTAEGGYYVEPTVFDRVDNQMTIAREEIFGPVLSTLTFKDAEEGLRIANDTVYGLAAAVWTKNIDTAHKMARGLRAGSVWINCFDGGDITTPFGGYKQSGFGRDKSLHAFDKYTELKTVWIELGG